MRGSISIDAARCKGCELCVTFCPKGVIALAPHFTPQGYHPAMLVDPTGACTGCLLCATVCPEGGIPVYREAARRGAPAPTPA